MSRIDKIFWLEVKNIHLRILQVIEISLFGPIKNAGRRFEPTFITLNNQVILWIEIKADIKKEKNVKIIYNELLY